MESRSFIHLPQIDRLLQEPVVVAWFALLSRPIVAKIASEVVASEREHIGRGGPVLEISDIAHKVSDRCGELDQKRLKPVINATGIVIHTNMGRAPIPRVVWAAAEAVNTGYSNLELDLNTGKRGRRNGIIPDLLSILVGCEAALIVNNCAAAIYIMLTTLAEGREVIVSRGEQVQIGGGFRIPEILRLSGAHLVEVGTTNITTVADYVAAVTEETAMVLIVHNSNFTIEGFTDRPSVREIRAALPPRIILSVDQGSGVTNETIPDEIRVGTYLKTGADLVSFSGDKVLGGPQAGFVVGKRILIDEMDSHPIARTLRTGKTIRALTEDFLIRKVASTTSVAAEEAMNTGAAVLKLRGKRIMRGLGDHVRLVSSVGAIGGGSAPGESFRSVALELMSTEPPDTVLGRLRSWNPPVIGTISEGHVRLDLSTVHESEVRTVSDALRAVLAKE